MKVERNSNIELLRIVLMLIIIFWHCVVHYCDNIYFENVSKPVSTLLFMSFSAMAVNSFLAISGLFGIKFKIERLVSFIVQALFYSVSIFVFFKLTFHGRYAISETFPNVIFPITFGKWWFLSTYVTLFLISPFLNKGVEYLSKKQFLALIIILLVFEFLASIFKSPNWISGTSDTLYHFIVVYLTIRFFILHNVSIKYPSISYLFFSLALFCISIILFFLGYKNAAWRCFNINSLIVIAQATSFLYIFKNIKIRKMPFLNKIGSATLGIYLIHDSLIVRHFLKEHLNPFFSVIDNSFILFIYMLITSLVIFIICFLIECTRSLICKPFVKLLSEKVELLANKL